MKPTLTLISHQERSEGLKVGCREQYSSYSIPAAVFSDVQKPPRTTHHGGIVHQHTHSRDAGRPQSPSRSPALPFSKTCRLHPSFGLESPKGRWVRSTEVGKRHSARQLTRGDSVVTELCDMMLKYETFLEPGRLLPFLEQRCPKQGLSWYRIYWICLHKLAESLDDEV